MTHKRLPHFDQVHHHPYDTQANRDQLMKQYIDLALYRWKISLLERRLHDNLSN